MEHYFSVVIAAYNASDFIGKTLDSVRSQTYTNYEVIVVDDGSPVCMKKAVQTYQAQYPEFPLRYVWQENQGPAGARKKCVEEAKFDYVAFLDHDDAWYENKLEVVNKTIDKMDADIYYHDENEVQEDGKISPIRYRSLNADPLTDLIINGNTLSTSAVVIKRQSFIDCDPYSDKMRAGEDYECWIRLAKYGLKFCHINQILGEYRRLAGSLTMINIDYMKATNERIVDFYDYLDKKKFSDKEIFEMKEKRKALNEYLIGRYYHSNGDFKKAREYYRKSRRMGNRGWKCLAADVLTYFGKKINSR